MTTASWKLAPLSPRNAAPTDSLLVGAAPLASGLRSHLLFFPGER